MPLVIVSGGYSNMLNYVGRRETGDTGVWACSAVLWIPSLDSGDGHTRVFVSLSYSSPVGFGWSIPLINNIWSEGKVVQVERWVGQVSGVCTTKNCRMAGVAEAADVQIRRVKARNMEAQAPSRILVIWEGFGALFWVTNETVVRSGVGDMGQLTLFQSDSNCKVKVETERLVRRASLRGRWWFGQGESNGEGKRQNWSYIFKLGITSFSLFC